MAENPSKMNINKFEVICSRRLAEECDATLNRECHTLVCSEENIDNRRKENEDDTGNRREGNGKDHLDSCYKDEKNPSKMNTNRFKVIFTKRLAKDECDATLNPEFQTVVCSEDDFDNRCKENEDGTNNWLKGNEDNTDNRQKENEDDIDNPHKENEDDTDNLQKAVKRVYPFSVIDFIVVFLSVIFSIIDVVTDIMLAKDYYNDGLMLEFALTSLFVTGSFLVTGILSSIWHAHDEKIEIEKKKRNYRNICYLILRFPFATIERYIKYAIHGCKSKQKGSNKFYHYIEMIYTDIDGILLRMLEAFIESAPQLVLQIYLILREQENLKNCEDIEVHSDILRMLTILSSCVSISWTVTAYYQVIRFTNARTHQKTLLSFAGYFLWRVFEIGSRVMALVMMILINPIIFVLIVVFHWFADITWSFATKAKPYNKFHENAIFFVFVGFVQVFSFMNITAGPSRSNAWLYYIFFYFENIVILILWIIVKKESYCPWIYYGTIGVVSSSIVFTVVFIACFYKLCHPKIGLLKEY